MTQTPLFPIHLEHTVRELMKLMAAGSSPAIRSREFIFHGSRGVLLYHGYYSDQNKLETHVLRPIQEAHAIQLQDTIPILAMHPSISLEEVKQALLQGHCAILLQGSAVIWLADLSVQPESVLTEPQNEQVVRGSQEGFNDDIDSNIQSIHKRLSAEQLRIQTLQLGKKNKTQVSILYVDSLAQPSVVQAIADKLNQFPGDYVKSPGQVSDSLETSPWSLFPQMLYTERVDTCVSHLMEGKVIVFINGSNSALVLPVTFYMFYEAADDATARWWNGTFFRILRLSSSLITLALPAIYIAIVSFHYEVLPIDIVFSLKASLENIPFDPLLEALFMMMVLELLREAALRLPKPIAPTLSIVGGLVIGTEVVRANLVSTTMIVVISLTAVASFSLPSNEMRNAYRLVSFPLLFAAAMLGFPGIVLGFSLLLMHLCKLETYGVPYFYPAAPLKVGKLLQAFIQLPSHFLKNRQWLRREDE
ncbi:spore germination protein [Paenibacillus sp. GCM10023252]|uniref:spore germination protein n=1 Tax=Paenibacillus sp. GCM10023252 TaxID=3252649 RepID=UPI003609D031